MKRVFTSLLLAIVLFLSMAIGQKTALAADTLSSNFLIPITIAYDGSVLYLIGADDTVWQYAPKNDLNKLSIPTGGGNWRLNGIIQFINGKTIEGYPAPYAALTSAGDVYYYDSGAGLFNKITGISNVRQLAASLYDIYALDGGGNVWALCGYNEWQGAMDLSAADGGNAFTKTYISLGSNPVKVDGIGKIAVLTSRASAVKTSDLTTSMKSNIDFPDAQDGQPYRVINYYAAVGMDNTLWLWGLYGSVYGADGSMTSSKADLAPIQIPLPTKITYYGKAIADPGTGQAQDVGRPDLVNLFNTYADGSVGVKRTNQADIMLQKADGSGNFILKLPNQPAISAPASPTATDNTKINLDPRLTVQKQGKITMTIGDGSYYIDGSPFTLDAPAYIASDGRTMVPIRFIAEAMGAKVTWHDDTQTDDITLDNKTISVTVGKSLPNGMGAAAMVSDRLFVPVRYISESLGATVDWNAANKQVTITALVPMSDAEVIASIHNNTATVISLANQEREKAGLKPLTADSTLMAMAQFKAEDMRDNKYFDHTSPLIGGVTDLAKKFNFNSGYIGENLTRGSADPASAMQSWMNSPGHRDNILNPEYNKIGVGMIFDMTYGVLWAMELSK